MKTLISLIIINSIAFCLMSHPLTSGLILLIQTILIALISGTMAPNFWFSYVVFLIMIGGMLVLFIYMTSVASNEKFKFSPAMAIIISATTLTSLAMLLIDSTLYTTPLQALETTPTSSSKPYELTLNKYLNYPHSTIYIMMVMYLLITLIAIVKITIKAKGTLRQSF